MSPSISRMQYLFSLTAAGRSSSDLNFYFYFYWMILDNLDWIHYIENIHRKYSRKQCCDYCIGPYSACSPSAHHYYASNSKRKNSIDFSNYFRSTFFSCFNENFVCVKRRAFGAIKFNQKETHYQSRHPNQFYRTLFICFIADDCSLLVSTWEGDRFFSFLRPVFFLSFFLLSQFSCWEAN